MNIYVVCIILLIIWWGLKKLPHIKNIIQRKLNDNNKDSRNE